MKFLIPLILLGTVIGCALQQDLDNLKIHVKSNSSAIILHEQDIRDLEKTKAFEDLKLIEAKFVVLKDSILILAGEIDKHSETIEILAENDRKTKIILEASLRLFENLNKRDKLIIEELDKK